MNYPVWDLAVTGGGLFIALIAITHVYIAHFAVGGGFFLVITEWKAHRDNNPALLDYVKGHTWFFLLLTMVLGALTGVGIWLAISAVHPGATSILIHTFVFAWGTEWVFFVVEIISLLVYYHTFHKMPAQNHLNVGLIYFIAAWLSLFIINGIIGFMFTPGLWLETKDFWDGFFNPSFWPALLFRTAMALILAGIYGLITAFRLEDEDLRIKVVRYCAYWVLLPFALLVPATIWYLASIPPEAKAIILGGSRDSLSFARTFQWLAPVIFLLALFIIWRRPKARSLALASVLLILGLLFMGSFEYVRETGRRPFVIYGHMYSNGVLETQLPDLQKEGVLKTARWSRVNQLTDSNQNEAGREMFNLLCLSCHSVAGPRNDILVQIRNKKLKELNYILQEMGDSKAFMPPFPGTVQERQALASYLAGGLPGYN